MLTDAKYHLLKSVLVRTENHSYLKEMCLLGDKMLNSFTEMQATILVNRGVIDSAKTPWIQAFKNKFNQDKPIQELIVEIETLKAHIGSTLGNQIMNKKQTFEWVR